MGADRNEGKWMQTQGGGHVIICGMAVFNFDPCSIPVSLHILVHTMSE